MISSPVTRAGLPPSGGKKGFRVSLSTTYFGIVWGSMGFVSCQGSMASCQNHALCDPRPRILHVFQGLGAFKVFWIQTG